MYGSFGHYERMKLRELGFIQSQAHHVEAPANVALPFNNEQHFKVELVQSEDALRELGDQFEDGRLWWQKAK